MEVTMDIKQPVGNTAGFGWPSCCHISYWLAQGNIFLRSSAAFSFLGMNTALGYKRFEYHLERNGIPRAFFNTTSNHSFVTMEAFIHFLFGGVPNNRGDKYVPSENVKTMRQYVLSKITEVKTDTNVNENPPSEETLEGGQAFDSISEITGDNNLQPLQVISNVERTEPANITSQPQSQEASIVVYIQTQEASENQPMESTAEQATFDNIRYTDPLPSFQQVGNPEPVPESVPEPEPTSDATCEVMASGFGGGQEGNKETFLQEEQLRTIPTIAEAEIPYCMHEEGQAQAENCRICHKRPRNPADQSSDKPFSCAICHKTFPGAAHLKRHQRTHTGEKPHLCKYCGKTFALAQNLKLHLRVHTGEKPYACTFCDKKYPGHSDLARHLRTHTGERPYKCDHCSKAFVSSSSLRKHHLVHTGERPYDCPDCPQTFKRRWHLVLHIRTHTGEKPHACHLCGKAYRDRTNLNKHLRAHSSGKLEAKQQMKEQREAIKAAKTLTQSKRKRKQMDESSNLQTKEACSSEEPDKSDPAGPSVGTKSNSEHVLPSPCQTSPDSSKSDSGPKPSQTSSSKKSGNEKIVKKSKTVATSTRDIASSLESTKEQPTDKEGDVYVVHLQPIASERDGDTITSSQAEKLQADVKRILAAAIFSGTDESSKTSIAGTKETSDLPQ